MMNVLKRQRHQWDDTFQLKATLNMERIDFKNYILGTTASVTVRLVRLSVNSVNGHRHHTMIGLSGGFKGQADKLKEI